MSNFHFPTGVQEMHPLSYNHDGSVIKSSHATAFPKGVSAAHAIAQVNPSTAISSSLSSQQMIDFNIQSQGVLENVYCLFTVANGSNTTAATSIWAYTINRVEVLDGLGGIMETLYSDNLMIDELLFADRDTFGRMVTNAGISSTFSTVSITTASSATFMVKIPSFWEAAHPNLGTLSSPLRLRLVVQLQNLVAGDSTLLTLTDLKLYTHGHALGPNHAADVAAKRSVDQSFRYLKHVRVASEQFTAASQNQFRLSNSNGECAYLWFVVRPVAGGSVGTTANNFNWQACASGFELLAADNSIIGAKVLPVMNKIVTSSYFPGQVCADKDHLFVLPFSVDPVSAKHGSQTGAFPLTSFEQLRIYNSLSGTYQIDVYAAMYAKATITRDGILTGQ